MQVLLAYAFDRQPDPADVRARIQRVADYYAPLWQVPVDRRGVDERRLGLHIWDAAESPWRWPSWDANEGFAVATLYLPLGYERVVGDVEPKRAARKLAAALSQRPASTLELTAPFVVASLAAAEGLLRLHTDGLGIGRLFELRSPDGWVWSNRPAAACRFGRVRAEPDRDGWRMLAASGWFLGDRTPFARVFAVPGGSTIEASADGIAPWHSRIDALAAWSGGRDEDVTSPDRVAEVGAALVALIASLDRMSPRTITADLSGGRDSRLVAAAALAAGLIVNLKTGGAEPGEAEVAKRLVAALPAEAARRISHRISQPIVVGPARTFGLSLSEAVVPNAVAWHRYQEGLRSPTYLPSESPRGLAPGDHVVVGGAGGEIAHGHYYPRDYVEISRLRRPDRLDALTERLSGSTLSPWGVSVVARATATARVRRTLEEALISGLDDVRALDYFYAAERLRRWGTTAERAGMVSPLLVPEFIRAAFGLTPEQRRANELHRAVTAHLMPAWKDLPYYRRPPDVVAPAFTARLGHAVDAADISALIAASGVWADGYDVTQVKRSWRSLLAGRGRAADERLLQRVIWRAAFEDFTDDVNDERGTPLIPLDEPPSLPDPGLEVRTRRFAARALRKLTRIVEPG